MDLIKMLVDQFGGQIVSGLAGNLGIGDDDARSAIDGALPSILGGLINKVGTSAGTDELFDIVKDDEYGGGMLDNIGDLFGGGENSSLLTKGLQLLPLLMGGNSKMGTILDIAGRVFGGGSGRSRSVFSMLAPLVISFIGKRLRGGNDLSKSGLVDMLLGQKRNVAERANPEIAREMGFSHWLSKASETTGATSSGHREERVHHTEESSSGGGFPKWLWPLLLLGLLGLLLFGLMRGCNTGTDTKIDRTNTQQKIERTEVKKDVNRTNNQIKQTDTRTNTQGSTTTNTNTNTRTGTNNATTRPAGSTTTTGTTTNTGTRGGTTTSSNTTTGGSTTTASGSAGTTYSGVSKQFSDAAASGASTVINFGSLSPDGKALSSSARSTLNQIADIMKANPAMNIVVRGHNKDHGNKIENGTARAASKVRAGLVQAHLITKGVKGNRVKTKTMGHDEVLGGVPGTDDRQKRITVQLVK